MTNAIWKKPIVKISSQHVGAGKSKKVTSHENLITNHWVELEDNIYRRGWSYVRYNPKDHTIHQLLKEDNGNEIAKMLGEKYPHTKSSIER